MGESCLVYSIGSAGDYSFEKGVLESISQDCEIHVFDMNNWSIYTNEPPPKGVIYHAITIGKSSHNQVYGKSTAPIKSPQQIFQYLGHYNKTIDILKLDCEGCEYNTYKDWFGGNPFIRQIQLELHASETDYFSLNSSSVHDMFHYIFEQGYVVFHKEPNLLSGGNAVEFAFLQLNLSSQKSLIR